MLSKSAWPTSLPEGCVIARVKDDAGGNLQIINERIPGKISARGKGEGGFRYHEPYRPETQRNLKEKAEEYVRIANRE